jgi:hypothetical protein
MNLSACNKKEKIMSGKIRPISRETAIELNGSEIDSVSGGWRSTTDNPGTGPTTTVMTKNGDVWNFDGDKVDD